MPYPPIKKTFEGLVQDNLTRLTLVERRLALGTQLPERIGPGGTAVYDWNMAIQVGFYWAEPDAANSPLAGAQMVGVVYLKGGDTNPRIVQELTQASSTLANLAKTWRRATGDLTGVSGWTVWVAVDRVATSADVGDLTTTDLNTVLETGWFVQSANANATAARNYPIPRAGHLQMSWSSASSDFGQQTYTDYQNYSQWVRTVNGVTWQPWKLTGMARGPGARRAEATPGYWDFWQDTDGSQFLWVGSRAGTWRQYSGTVTFASAAWDSVSTTILAGRTVTTTLPTFLETNESLIVVLTSGGTGFTFLSLNALTRNATTTPITLRYMQILSVATQAGTFSWQIVQN